jgi:hypothetical protein
MHVLSFPSLPDVDTQWYNVCLSYIFNIIQELVELTMFTFKYNFIKNHLFYLLND